MSYTLFFCTIVGGDRAYTIALAPSAPAIALSTAINNLMMVSHFDFVDSFIRI